MVDAAHWRSLTTTRPVPDVIARRSSFGEFPHRARHLRGWPERRPHESPFRTERFSSLARGARSDLGHYSDTHGISVRASALTCGLSSAPAPTRTGDLPVRSLTLYPAELRAQ